LWIILVSVCLPTVFARYHLGLRARLAGYGEAIEGQILTPFDMTMGVMSIYICAAIAYNLGKHYVKSYQLDPFMCAMLSLMAFLLVAAPKTKGTLPVDSLGGRGSLPPFWWQSTA
jgi:cellobiose-specific phosphotransferase system component IIC